MTAETIVCSYCGNTEATPHNKYGHMCDSCGRVYHKYTVYKSQQKRAFKQSRANVLHKLEAYYIDMKIAGFNVPRDFK